MKRIAHIVQSSVPCTAVQFRKTAYGKQDIRNFLRDVLAIANASVDGARYIVTGVEFDYRGRKKLFSVNSKDFSGKPAYQALANDHIEPPIRIRYQPVTVAGERVGVFEIGDCQDRPYMMRVDHSEKLRRGDAYVRINDSIIKMGRSQLQALFEKKFRDSISAANIEVGFPGEIIHKDIKITTCSFATLPSVVASTKLTELIDAKSRIKMTAANTIIARLTHARLFGSDSPYEERSTEEIVSEMRQLERQYIDHDNHFLFEEHRSDVQNVIVNEGDEPLHDASMSLTMPAHDALRVATCLPKFPRDNKFVARTPGEQSDYPAVSLHDDGIKISSQLGDIPPGEPVEVFRVPLRVCIGDDLKGRRIGIQYSLFAHNLRSPAKGKLRIQL